MLSSLAARENTAGNLLPAACFWKSGASDAPAHLRAIVYGCFPATTAALSSYDRDWSTKTKNFYHLALCS